MLELQMRSQLSPSDVYPRGRDRPNIWVRILIVFVFNSASLSFPASCTGPKASHMHRILEINASYKLYNGET